MYRNWQYAMYIKRVKKESFHIFVIHQNTKTMKTLAQTLRKVFMWYEVKELSSIPGNSDNKIAQMLGIDRRTVLLINYLWSYVVMYE